MKKENRKPVFEQPKKKMKKRTIFTIFAVVNLFWYTITVLVLSFFDKIVPPELTAGWFAAWTVELALLFGIKIKSKDATDYGYTPNQFNWAQPHYNENINYMNQVSDNEDTVDNEFVEDQIEMQNEDTVSNYDDSLTQ